MKLNDEEITELASLFDLSGKNEHECAQQLNEQFNLEITIVTRGELGAVAIDRSGNIHEAKAIKAQELVDTVGCGDSFSAGFIKSLLEGHNLQQCCSFGNAMGALNASKRGAMTPFTQEEIQEIRY